MQNETPTPMIEMRGISKRFGRIVSNRNTSLKVYRGEILSLLGENGSGKTSLMNMLAGIYYPDEGHIYVDGKEVIIANPSDAYQLKIGMVHQHFMLVDIFNAAENIILGLPGKQKLDLPSITKELKEIADRYGFVLDFDKRVYEMSVSEKQTVEILKILYRGADILILDEPTAVLTPQENERLFDILRKMRDDGKSIIIITHKLHEVLALSDRVEVLRKGENTGSIRTCDATEAILTEMMVGKKVELNIARPKYEHPKKKLELLDVTVLNEEGREALSHATVDCYTGEILGIAGISGSGQKELLDAIAGLAKTATGSIRYDRGDGSVVELTEMTPGAIRELGIRLAFVPEDRLGMGLVSSMGITDNISLRTFRNGFGPFRDTKKPRKTALDLIDRLGIVTPGADWAVGMLSGGNVQKVLVGREISYAPKVLMVAYPVRGLDINSAYQIYDLLNSEKMKGTCILCVGEDLDVLLALSDRIMVLSGGRVSGIVDAKTATKEELGLLMTNADIRNQPLPRPEDDTDDSSVILRRPTEDDPDDFDEQSAVEAEMIDREIKEEVRKSIAAKGSKHL